MPGTAGFYLDWVSGSSAVVDLQAQGRDNETRFLLRYTSPFRPTMRAPQQELTAGPPEFAQINRDLDRFASRSVAGVRRGGGAAPAPVADSSELAELGQQLFEMVLPRLVRSDLRQEGLFIELGTDEELLHLPWEVMHDGTGFICLKHYLGRYVNLRRTPELQARAMPEPGSSIDDLGVLLIAVPDPRPQDGQVFDRLPSVERETEAIIRTLGAIGVQPRVLAGRDATAMRVLRALRENYHIIHFSGHAAFDPRDANRTSIVLDDTRLSVARLTPALAEQTAVLCVVNACETTRSGGGQRPAGGTAPAEDTEQLSWRDQYNMYGLARAFLENGAYVLGSRWKIPDDSAQLFAETFYGSFLGQGHPIGQAITEARVAVHQAAEPSDFSWASYVYYGDPRLTLRLHARGSQGEGPADADDGPADADEGPADADEGPTAVGGEPTAVGGGGVPMGLDQDSTTSGNPTIDDLLGEVPLPEPEMSADPGTFDQVVTLIERPPSDAEEAQALRAAGRMLGALSADQRERLTEVLEERAAAPELLGTDRILLVTQLRARLGD